jgi:hypothetical protein
MHNILATVSLFLFVTFSTLTTSAQSGVTIRIDPQRTYGGAVSNYFSEVEYIKQFFRSTTVVNHN